MPEARVWVAGVAEDTTDAQGTFSLPGLGAGTWVVESTAWPAEAFGHSAQVEVEVGAAGMRTVRVELPSVTALALERCRANPTPPGQATLLGRVVDADGLPVPGAAVRILWSSVLAIGRGGAAAGREGVALFADGAGAFVQCGVPVGSVELQGTVDDVESPLRRVQVPVGTALVTGTVVMPRAPR